LSQGAFLTTFCSFKDTLCWGPTVTLLSSFNEAISTLRRIKKLRRFVEKTGTTSTIQEVMILFNTTLGELFRKIIPLSRTGFHFNMLSNA